MRHLAIEATDEAKGTTFKHRIAEVHAIGVKRLAKVEAADDPTDGADDESSPPLGVDEASSTVFALSLAR
jgi:single-strand DNA-binding protein